MAGASHYLGSSIGDCGWQCKEVRNLWFSPIFTFFSIALPIVAIVLHAVGDNTNYRRIALIEGGLAVIALGLTSANQWFCVVCLSIQIVWLSLAVETVKFRIIGGAAYLLTLLGLLNFLGQVSENRTLASVKEVEFGSRPFESRISGSTFVIFTDPLCSACRSKEQLLVAQNPKTPIIYRWKLLSQHGDFALRTACAIESALAIDTVKGFAFFKAVYAEPLPLVDLDILKRGVSCGLDRASLTEWLRNPEQSSLQFIREDGSMANNLRIEAVPCLAQVVIRGEGGPPKISLIDSKSLEAQISRPEFVNWKGLSIFLSPSRQNDK